MIFTIEKAASLLDQWPSEAGECQQAEDYKKDEMPGTPKAEFPCLSQIIQVRVLGVDRETRQEGRNDSKERLTFTSERRQICPFTG